MTDSPTKGTEGRPPLARAALFGLCPECGARSLFAGPVNFAPRCTACGLDFARYNVGDGPAAILIMIIGTIIVGGAVWLQLAAHPPFWVHILLWLPLTVVLVLLGLRAAKGALIAAEHQRNAHEGQLAPPEREDDRP